jgi:MoaD family protein
MVFIKVKAILKMAEVLGCYEQVIALPEGSCLENLLNILEDKYGQPFNKTLYSGENRQLNLGWVLFINGRNIVILKGFETDLNDGDELFILPPLGGG